MAAYEAPLLSGVGFPIRHFAPNHSWGYVVNPPGRVIGMMKGKGAGAPAEEA